MDAAHVIKNPQELTSFTRQHNRMLELCSQLADLDMPALVRTLSKMRALAGAGPSDSELERTRRLVEENLALALCAIEIRAEVCRQKARYVPTAPAGLPRPGQRA